MGGSRVSSFLLMGVLLALPAFGADTATPPADKSLDDLFNDLEEGLPTAPVNVPVTPDTGKRPMFLYFGTLDTQGVGVTGYTDEAYTNQISSIYYYLHLKAGLDVMPIPEARLIGSFSTYLPQDIDSTLISTVSSGNTTTVQTTTTSSSNSGSVLTLDELYLDYAVLQSAMFRVGKYAVTWGQGKLFNPGNLVSSTSEAVNLRAFAPVGPFTLTGLIIGNKSFFATASKPKAEELGYASNIEFKAGPVSGGLSVYHQLIAGSTSDLMLRTGFWGFDFYGEALAHHYVGSSWAPSYMLGMDREFDLGFKVQAVAEYWCEGRQEAPFRRHVGLALATGALESGLALKLSAKWLHSITDGSGQVVVGLTSEPLPKVKFALGVPWTYGAASSYYVTNNSDLEDRRLSLLFSVTIGFDFEKDR